MSLPDRVFVGEIHLADTNLSKMSRTDVAPDSGDNLSGWYIGYGTITGMVYITEHIESIFVQVYGTFNATKPYYLDRANPNTTFTLEKIGSNYTFPGFYSYVYDPVARQFNSNQNNFATVYAQSGTFFFYPFTMTKVAGADEKYWRYNMELNEFDTIYNDFQHFFEFIYHNYTAGRLSGFTERSLPVPTLGINPFNLDYSKMKRSIGAKSRTSYDSLYRQLCTTGIVRSYQVGKLVYWVKNKAGIDPAIITALQGEIIQQRDQFIAFYPKPAAEPNETYPYPKLCPGSRVTITGTGTRLDGTALLATGGYSSAPDPGPQFANTAISAYNYYSIVLPLVLDASNNKVVYSLPGSATKLTITVPEGPWYLPRIFNYLNKMYAFLYARFVYVNTPTIPGPPFPNRQLTLSQPYAALDAIPGSTWYGAESTLFGPNGMGLDYLFNGGNLVANADGVVFTAIASPMRLRTHTPLTAAEVTTLYSNMDQMTVTAKVGPVHNDMDYDNFIACIQELQIAMCTEVHAAITGYCQIAEYQNAYLFWTREELDNALNNSVRDYSYFYNNTLTGVLPNMQQVSIRLGLGNMTEGSDFYKMGPVFFGRSRSGYFLSWLWPDLDGAVNTTGGLYPPNTIVNFGGTNYDMSGRAIEIPIVNYLEDPQWMQSTPLPDGTPQVTWFPYAFYESTFSWNPNWVLRPEAANIIIGQHLIGIIREDRVRQALNRPVGDVPRLGYFTYYTSDFALTGNAPAQGWYELDAGFMRQGATLAGAAIMRYFNERGVQSFYVDVRNSAGGIALTQTAIMEHAGADRAQRYSISGLVGGSEKKNTFNDIGVAERCDHMSLNRNGENRGVFDYNYVINQANMIPQRLVADGIFEPIDIFGGPAPNPIPGLNQQRVILWNISQSTTSATQDAWMGGKGCSLTTAYDGDWGNNVQWVGWGSYNRPFSTGGNYTSAINWYGRNAKSMEEQKIPPIGFDARFESGGTCLLDPNGVIIGDDVWSRFQEQNISWDMQSKVFFADIGYTVGNPTVNPLQGEPWVPQRYPGIDFNNPLTYRDSILEKAIRMMCDPDLNTHFFKQDGYGNV